MTVFIDVEVVYALSDNQVLKKLEVPVGTTVAHAIQQSGIIDQFPDIDLSRNSLGIFSQFVQSNTILQPRDRIEIYRPLIIDPKEARRHRAKSRKIAL